MDIINEISQKRIRLESKQIRKSVLIQAYCDSAQEVSKTP